MIFQAAENDVTELRLLRSKRSIEEDGEDDLFNKDDKTDFPESSSKASNDNDNKVDEVKESTEEEIVEVHHNTVDQFFFNKTSDQV